MHPPLPLPPSLGLFVALAGPTRATAAAYASGRGRTDSQIEGRGSLSHLLPCFDGSTHGTLCGLPPRARRWRTRTHRLPSPPCVPGRCRWPIPWPLLHCLVDVGAGGGGGAGAPPLHFASASSGRRYCCCYRRKERLHALHPASRLALGRRRRRREAAPPLRLPVRCRGSEEGDDAHFLSRLKGKPSHRSAAPHER